MAGFGLLAPEDAATPDWRDAEASLSLALQQADAAKKEAAGRSWGDTMRGALAAPGRIFGALSTSPDPRDVQDQQAMMPETFQNPLVKNVMGGAGEAIASGATLPGDVVAGKVPMVDADGNTSPEMIRRSFDMASIAGGGSVAGSAAKVAEDSARAGAPIAAVAPRSTGFGTLAPAINPLDNADQLKELANVRRTKGWTVGKQAPGWDFERPEAPKGSWGDTVARTNAAWDADKARAVAGYEQAAGSPPVRSPLLTPEDHDFINSTGFYSDTAKPGAAVDTLEHVGGTPVAAQRAADQGFNIDAYHGTSAPEFDAFKRKPNDIGIHFGTADQANDRISYMGDKRSGDPHVYPVKLKINNPLRLPDLGSWDSSSIRMALEDHPHFVRQDVARAANSAGNESGRVAALRDLIEEHGHDGIVYKNTGETGGSEPYRQAVADARAKMDEAFGKAKYSFTPEDQKNPAYQEYSAAERSYDRHRNENAQDSYIAFRPNQVRSQFAEFNPKNAKKGGLLLEDSAASGAPVVAVEHALDHPAIRQAFHDEMGPQAGQSAYDAYLAQHGTPAPPEAAAGPTAAPRGNGPGGAGGGDAGLAEAQAAAARRAGAGKPLEGLPTKAMKIGDEHFVPGPIASVRDVAEQYMADRPKSAYYQSPTQYHPLDPEHSTAIAKAFDEMKHTPNDPATKASYDALTKETRDQFQAVKNSGLKIEPITPGMADPYAANPRLAAKDVADNNHLWFFPTDQGFGSNAGSGINLKKHPMMQPSGETLDGKPLLNNDLFRVVHDYFGHLKEGYGFRAAGEDNAWRSHAAMYSDLARPAMTTETRGQNSWVNYGPHGETNRTASAADTTYADQKVGLMPEWTMRDRGSPEPKIVYHGSPHAFDQVDTAKVGSGQGANTFGRGFYSAEEPKIAKNYRDELSAGRSFVKDGKSVPWHHVADDIVAAVHDLGGYHGDQAADIVNHVTTLMEQGKSVASIRKNYDAPPGHEAAWDAALKAAAPYSYNKNPGHVYQLAIDHPEEKFLDWDTTFKEQHPDVQAAARPFLEERLAAQDASRKRTQEKANSGDRNAIRAVRGWKPAVPLEDLPGSKIHQMMGLPAKTQDEAFDTAAMRLKDAGVPGIRYLDQFSRGRPNNRTRNFVTFDAPRVLKRYAIPGAAGTAGFGSLAPSQDEQ